MIGGDASIPVLLARPSIHGAPGNAFALFLPPSWSRFFAPLAFSRALFLSLWPDKKRKRTIKSVIFVNGSRARKPRAVDWGAGGGKNELFVFRGAPPAPRGLREKAIQPSRKLRRPTATLLTNGELLNFRLALDQSSKFKFGIFDQLFERSIYLSKLSPTRQSRLQQRAKRFTQIPVS